MRMLAFSAALLAASPALAASWVLQPQSSMLGFSGTQTGTAFTGSFTRWTAQIAYDPAHPAAAHIHIAIDTASAHTGDSQKDQAMPDSDWFDSAAFPAAVFDASGFTPLGGDKFTTAGTLTIRGTARKITLPFTLDVAGGTATAKGQISLTRTDYGVGQGAWTSGAYVGLPVDVTFTVVAKQGS